MLKQEGEFQHKTVWDRDFCMGFRDFDPCIKLTKKDHKPDMNVKSP